MNHQRPLKAVVFDYNGVLVDDIRIHARSYWQAGRDMGFDVSYETVWEHISQPPSQKRKLYYGDISDDAWQAVFGLKKKHYYEIAKGASILFDDTAAALTALSARFKLAVLSNTFRFFFDEFFPSELAGLFSTTLFYEEMDVPKPAPDPMRTVLKRLGVAAAACCYVGDALEDIQMARAAGTQILSLTTGGCTREQLAAGGADRIFGSLREAVAWLIP